MTGEQFSVFIGAVWLIVQAVLSIDPMNRRRRRLPAGWPAAVDELDVPDQLVIDAWRRRWYGCEPVRRHGRKLYLASWWDRQACPPFV